MAVLVEGISVVVRLDAIQQKVPGGWNAFKDHVLNKTLCADNELARVGFMTPDDVKSFVSSIEGLGLIYREGDAAVDIAPARTRHRRLPQRVDRDRSLRW
jgi:hypothetical protein